MSWIANRSLRRQLGVAFGVILAVLLIQTGFAFWMRVTERQASDSVTHTYRVMGLADTAIGGLVDMQTSYRGFMLTGTDPFLEPYTAGQQAYQGTLAQLEELTADNPPQLARWKDLEQRAMAWQRDVTEPGIALRRRVNTGAASVGDAASYVGTGIGYQQFTDMRRIFAEAVGVEQQLLIDRTMQANDASRRLLGALIGGTLIACILGVLAVTTVTRNIADGAGRLAATAQRIAHGELSSRIRLDREDEIGRAATAFDDMADHLEAGQADLQRSSAELTQQNLVLATQQEAIRELSTPILQVREGLLVLPLIGTLDSERAQLITGRLLQRVRNARARVVVLDITGVPTIDSSSAGYVLEAMAATRLLGATVLVTGLSPAIAIALSSIGIDLTDFRAVGDLQGGLQLAEQLLDQKRVRV